MLNPAALCCMHVLWWISFFFLQSQGLSFVHNHEEYKVRGKLVAFVGDTPAVNMVGGFKEGVGVSMRKCRQCMATYDQIQVKVSYGIVDKK
jgi:hypothetical protein